MPDVDLAVCCRMFVKRKIDNREKHRENNSSLPAGSPMFYYCRHCDDHLITLHEGHRTSVYTTCTPCDVLKKNGILPELVKLVEGDADAVEAKVGKFIKEVLVDAKNDG